MRHGFFCEIALSFCGAGFFRCERVKMSNAFMRRVGWKPVVGLACLTVLAVLVAGCRERGAAYRTPAEPVAQNGKILVLPFMDARTFVDSRDPHRADLGEYAREIFVASMRDNPNGKNAAIVLPSLPPQKTSLTNAQVAELGRQYGADMVVAGQVFSFTGTRAVSIPPRAGMFVRVVSARDGSLLFVGDHYQAANFPGAPGGRELQAKNVSTHLVDGIFAQSGPVVAKLGGGVASSAALASLPPVRVGLTANNGNDDKDDALPALPLLVGMEDDGANDTAEWDKQNAPAVPPIIDFNDDLYRMPAPAPEGDLAAAKPSAASSVATAKGDREQRNAEKVVDANVAVTPAPTTETTSAALPLPPPPPVEEERGNEAGAVAAVEKSASETAAPSESRDAAATTAAASGEESATHPSVDRFYASVEAEIPDASYAAGLSGDELAADIFAETFVAAKDKAAVVEPETVAAATQPETVVASAAGQETVATNVPPAAEVLAEPAVAAAVVSREVSEEADAAQIADAALRSEGTGETPESPARIITVTLDDSSRDDLSDLAAGVLSRMTEFGPVISVPLAIEQPRPLFAFEGEEKTGDAIALNFDSETALAASASAPIRVLVLPYHDRENPINLIPRTGGGEVVTTLYGARLALESDVQVLWDASGQLSHGRLIDKAEALQLGQMVGADFVIRGQVVEFRRAQSVPSFYSAVISTAALAAQIFFAETSGVDVATEVYRVSDGRCVMSRRDRSQQKYVVQAEKTVRRLAEGMAVGVLDSMRAKEPETMDPLIDGLEPLNLLARLK